MNSIGYNAPNQQGSRFGLVLIFLLLTISASWVASIGANWLQYSFMIATLMLCLTQAPFSHFNKRVLFSFFFLIFSVGLVCLARPDGYGKRDLFFLVQITIGFLAATTFGSNSRLAFSLFARVMYLLCLSSLALFPLALITPNLIMPIPDAFQNFFQGEIYENKRYYTLFGISYFVSSHGTDAIGRNQSIFWEPALFGYFATIALLVSDSIGGSKKEKAVFVAGVLSSYSPSAYALLILYFGLRIAKATKRGIVASGLVVLAASGIAALSFPLLHTITLLVFQRDIYTDASIYIRFTDFWLPYVVALDSPYWGFGTTAPYQDALVINIDRRVNGMTNSFGAYFYHYGYIWSALFIAWAFWAVSRVGPAFGAMPFMLFLGLMFAPIGFSSFIMFLLFVAIANRRGGSRFSRAPSSAIVFAKTELDSGRTWTDS